MLIQSLELKDFRNYDELSIPFDEGANILYGNNAQGKTNILEAIYLCSTTKSHKGSKDREMIRKGCEEGHVRMRVRRRDARHAIDMHLKRSRAKGIAIDGVPIRKSGDLVGLVSVVFFSPEDLGIIKSGPAERRRFVNMELCQMDGIYLGSLARYGRILAQRNNLLRQIPFREDLLGTLDAWDEQLVECGKAIIARRREFLEEIGEIFRLVHGKLTRGREEVELRYEPDTGEGEFADRLRKSRERDILLKSTGVGPHRDDVGFFLGESEARKYGSQGQQRTAALSLKLSEISLWRKELGESPVLLLDDVLSELDRERQESLLEEIDGMQTILTCTGLEELVRRQTGARRVYRIEGGKAAREAVFPEKGKGAT